MNRPKLILCDANPYLVDALKRAFMPHPEVEVFCAEMPRFLRLFALDARVAAVSPANSSGYMDGGIDLIYRNMFGLAIETDVMTVIRRCWGGALPVGQAEILHTLDRNTPFLIVAPTVTFAGQDVSTTENAYLAFKAVLVAVTEENRRGISIDVVVCPGLCTGSGRMPPHIAAGQMRLAYLNREHELTNQEFRAKQPGQPVDLVFAPPWPEMLMRLKDGRAYVTGMTSSTDRPFEPDEVKVVTDLDNLEPSVLLGDGPPAKRPAPRHFTYKNVPFTKEDREAVAQRDPNFFRNQPVIKEQ